MINTFSVKTLPSFTKIIFPLRFFNMHAWINHIIIYFSVFQTSLNPLASVSCWFCTPPRHKNGLRIYKRSWNPLESSTKGQFCCMQSARPTTSLDITLTISTAANASWCYWQELSWTSSVTLSCREHLRDFFTLHREWWHCCAVCPRMTCPPEALNTGRAGGSSMLKTSLLSTSPPF